MTGPENNGIRVSCSSSGWFPNPTVQWRDTVGNTLLSSSESQTQDGDGLFCVPCRSISFGHRESCRQCDLLHSKSPPQPGESKGHLPPRSVRAKFPGRGGGWGRAGAGVGLKGAASGRFLTVCTHPVRVLLPQDFSMGKRSDCLPPCAIYSSCSVQSALLPGKCTEPKKQEIKKKSEEL